jgi:type IV secretion/conjugal transfer VirB4 family ATPase
MNAPAYAAQMQREHAFSAYIPYSAHITPDTIITRDGDYIRMWRVDGITHETADAEEIQRCMDNLNTFIRAIGNGHIGFWTHTVRRKTLDRLEAEFDNEFCRKLNDRYYDKFLEKRPDGKLKYQMMASELYLTLIYRPHPSKIGRMFARAGTRTMEEIKAERAEQLRSLDDITLQLEGAMKGYGSHYLNERGERIYGIERLSAYEATQVDRHGQHHTFKCSRLLEFLNFLITGVRQRVRLPEAPLNEYLGNAWLHVGTETIEIRTPARTRFAQCIDFKDYTAHTCPGFMNSMLYTDYEYVITQSFSCLPKREGKNRLQVQANQLRTTEDVSPTQIKQMDEALDELEQGMFCMGEYHYTLLVYGESVQEVRKNVASAMATIGDMGFIASVVTTATDAAFFAQLPANWAYRPRPALLTSLNFCAFSSFHNFLSGKRDANPWGQAVTLLRSPSGQPLYFNFHASAPDENAYDKKLLGNTRIIGMSGAGKTVLMMMLFCQSQKFKPRSPTGYTDIFFDKDRGAEIAIRAVGGKYFAVQNGVPTGFNPFQLEPTETNIQFLNALVCVLIKGETDAEKLTTSDLERIDKAVRTVMRMPREVRRLALVPQNITEPSDAAQRENSVRKRLARWCSGGPLAWVLDNPVDQLDFTTHSSYGIDGTQFLDNALIRTPISMYLLFRMESIIDGRRFVYYMDECWKWIDDEAFSVFAGDKQLTIRKQNGLGVFATQMPSSLLDSKIAAAMVQQCATEIYLPNTSADEAEYTTGKAGKRGFGLTLAEFSLVKKLKPDSRMFLVKQGHRSSVAHLDLGGMDDEIAVLSGSTDNIELLHQIMAETGEAPEAWMPVFLAAVRNRKNAEKQTKNP